MAATRSFGELLDAGFDLVRRHVRVLLTIALPFYAVIGLLTESLDLESGAPAGQAALALGGLLIAIGVLGTPLVAGAVTHALGEATEGQDPELGEALAAGSGQILPLLWTWVVAVAATALAAAPLAGVALLADQLPGVLLFVAIVLAFAAPIWIAIHLMLLTQVAVLERSFGWRAVRRSIEITRGHVLRVGSVLFVAGMLVALLAAAAQLVVFWLPFGGTLVGAGVQAAGFVWGTALSVLLYREVCTGDALPPAPEAEPPYSIQA